MARDGARAVDQLSKKNETLKDTYKRRKAAIEAAGAAGLKTEAEVTTAVRQLKREVLDEAKAAKQAEEQRQAILLRSTDAYRKQQAQIKRGVDKVNELKRANKSLDAQHDELKRAIKAAYDSGEIEADQYKQSIRELGEETNRLKAKQQTSFGSGAIAQVGKYAASFLSVASVIQVISKALQKLKEDQENALNIGNELKESRTKLRGLGGNFGQLEKEADQISLDTGITRAKSREILFTGQSQDLSSTDVGLVAKLDPIVDALTGIKFAADLRQQFDSENLTAEQALNIALTASDTSKFDPNAILPQLQKASIGAAVQGASSADTAALVSVLGSKLGESTGLSVRSLLTQFAIDKEQRFTGLDGIESIEKFISLPKAEQDTFTGTNKQVVGSIKIATESLTQIKEVAAKIRAETEKSGTKESAVRREIGEAFSTETNEGLLLRSQRELGRAEIENEISTESVAIKAARRKADRLRGQTRLRDGTFLGGVAQVVEGFAESAGAVMEDAGVPMITESGERLDLRSYEEQQAQTLLLEKMAAGLAEQNNTPAAPTNQPLSIPGEDR
eukprot:GHVN01070119.1.p2 GENE.GHVN01070119.1~~GHVN01070119.1.p2  ORF type:complete len:601 (+),score=76.82 GHVN01070119.1:116-1804(+)